MIRMIFSPPLRSKQNVKPANNATTSPLLNSQQRSGQVDRSTSEAAFDESTIPRTRAKITKGRSLLKREGRNNIKKIKRQARMSTGTRRIHTALASFRNRQAAKDEGENHAKRGTEQSVQNDKKNERSSRRK